MAVAARIAPEATSRPNPVVECNSIAALPASAGGPMAARVAAR
jgi:hypothetical protein